MQTSTRSPAGIFIAGIFALTLCAPAAAAPGDVLDAISTPGCYASGLAWDGANLLVSNLTTAFCLAPQHNSYKIDRVRVSSGAVTGSVGSWIPHGLTVLGGSLYAQESWTDLVRYGADGSELDAFSPFSGLPYGLAADPTSGALYATHTDRSRIEQIDPGTGAILGWLNTELPGAGNADAAWDGCGIWVANLIEDALIRIHPDTGERLEEMPSPGPHTEGLTYDGTHLWAADNEDDLLYQVALRPDRCDPLSPSLPTPGVAGALNTWKVTGATPGQTVTLVGGSIPGSVAVPGCPGVRVDIAAPQIMDTAVADADGIASFSQVLPGTMTGGTLRTQAVQGGTCSIGPVTSSTVL